MSDSAETGVLRAYPGTDPYIFISYAHSDAMDVLSVVRELQKRHYRGWYDQGILPGNPWDENVASRLGDCECMLSFISKSYISSSNCRDELSLARALGKNMVLIHLDNTPMTPGLNMRYGRLFALFLHSIPEEEFFQKLTTMGNIGQAKEN